MSKMVSEPDISFKQKCSKSLVSKNSRSLRCNFLMSFRRQAKTETRSGKNGVLAFSSGCKINPLIRNKTILIRDNHVLTNRN